LQEEVKLQTNNTVRKGETMMDIGTGISCIAVRGQQARSRKYVLTTGQGSIKSNTHNYARAPNLLPLLAAAAATAHHLLFTELARQAFN